MIKLLINLHEAFFDNDISNKMVMGIGLGLGAGGCLFVLLLGMML